MIGLFHVENVLFPAFLTIVCRGCLYRSFNKGSHCSSLSSHLKIRLSKEPTNSQFYHHCLAAAG
jgi:hypothetical protein